MQREPKKHVMKALPEHFLQVCDGRKTFEIRKDDRNIQPGDIVELVEWSRYTGYTGEKSRELHITYVLRNCPEYGLKKGYCIFCWEN